MIGLCLLVNTELDITEKEVVVADFKLLSLSKHRVSQNISLIAVACPGFFFRGGVQQIQLRI